jgi:ectoine hydroxylase-related dioxygenase (phytanoyl-CoA dioxygenase family)
MAGEAHDLETIDGQPFSEADYYPGSHHLPYVFSKDVGIDIAGFEKAGFGLYQERYEPHIQKLIAENRLPPAHFHARKGDVLIWHANLLHGGSKRRDLHRTRRALVCHYFVKGAVTYHDLAAAVAHGSTGTCLLTDRPASRSKRWAFWRRG